MNEAMTTPTLFHIPSNDMIEQQCVYDALSEWGKTHMRLLKKLFNAMHGQEKASLK